MKVPKDLEEGKFILNTSLLPKKIMFEGPRLVRLPHIKLEDWDLANTKQFPHLDIDNFMHILF